MDMFDYPDLSLSLRPVIDCEAMPVIPRDAFSISSSETKGAHDDITVGDDVQAILHFPYQADLYNRIRDIGLTKSKSDLLTTRMRNWNSLYESSRVTKQK